MDSKVKKFGIAWLAGYPIFIIYQLFMWPVLITNDGTTYLSSARYIFHDEMLTNYYWIREPVYPLFLKFTLLFNDLSGVALIVLQSTLIYLAFYLSYKSILILLNINIENSKPYVYIIVLFFSGFFISYAAIVLQQAFLAFFLSTLIYLIIKIAKTSDFRNIYMYVIFYIALSIVTVNFLYQYLYIQIFSSTLVAFFISTKLYLHSSRKLAQLVFIVALSFLLSFIQFLSSAPWQNFKSDSLKYQLTQPLVDDSSEVWAGAYFPEPLEVISSNSFFFPEPNYFERFLMFYSLYEPELEGLWKENRFFVDLLLSERNKDSHLISAGWYPFLENTVEVRPYNKTSLNNIFAFSETFKNIFIHFNSLIYVFVVISFFIISIMLIFFRKNILFTQIFILLMISMIPYLMTWPVDRYSIPLYPFMASIVIGFFTQQRIGKRD
jgi:hypothetical protein